MAENDETNSPPDDPRATIGREQSLLMETSAGANSSPGTLWSVLSPSDQFQNETARQIHSGAAQFDLRKIIGQGGMGEVWSAEQRSLGREVAIKRIREDRLSQLPREAVIGEFRHEARITARLEHPNIVPVHDLGVDERGLPLLAMKYVQGESWSALLDRDRRKLDPPDFLAKHLAVLISVGQAVAFAHAAGVVHRDLKPAQVMVGEYGEVALMDWGLAVFVGNQEETEKLREARQQGLTTRESAASPAGTPVLMAPEQTRADAMALGPWTDVYLLGGTLYFILSGTYPHESSSPKQAIYLASLGMVEDPRVRCPGTGIPDDLAELAMHALAADPQQRVASAKDFVSRVQGHLGGASQRRESLSIAEEAGAELGLAKGNYRALSEVLSKLGNARTLWPKNPRLDPLVQQTLVEYARSALRHRDLVLARLQAERLPLEAREPLLLEIAEGERLNRNRETQRRMLARGVFVLMLAIITGGGIFTLRLQEESRAASLARARAESSAMQANLNHRLAQEREAIARDRYDAAWEMLRHTIEVHLPQLDLEIPKDRAFARNMITQIMSFTNRVDVSKDSAEEQGAHAELLQGLSIVLMDLGGEKEAVELAQKALALLDTIPVTDRSLASRRYHNLSAALYKTLQFEDARRMHQRAMELLEDGGIAEADARLILRHTGINLELSSKRFDDVVAQTETLIAEADQLIATLEEALKLPSSSELLESLGVEELPEGITQENARSWVTELLLSTNALRSRAYESKGHALRALDRLEEARAAYNSGLSLLSPYAPGVQSIGPDMVGSLAAVEMQLGNYREAAGLFRDYRILQQQVYGPDHPAVYRHDGFALSCLAVLGRRDELVRMADELLAFRRSQGNQELLSIAIGNAMEAWHRANEPEETLKLAEQMVAMPDDDDDVEDIVRLRIEARLRLMMRARALEDLDDARLHAAKALEYVKRLPEDAVLMNAGHHHLAIASLLLGDNETALRQATKAYGLIPEEEKGGSRIAFDIEATLVKALIVNGHHEATLPHLRTLRELPWRDDELFGKYLEMTQWTLDDLDARGER